MEISGSTRVGDIVKQNFKTAKLFESNSIDFCCGGGISIDEACKKSNIDAGQLMEDLNDLLQQRDADSAYINGLAPGELCDYIEKRHHSYVNDTIPFLQQKLQKLCDVHGAHHPELFTVKELFDGAAGNLSAHMKKEELILFPLIRRMADSEINLSEQKYQEAVSTIETMFEEHQTEGDRFEHMSEITSGYTCPPDGCNTYRVTYQTLKEFEDDLHRHIHLENNILFRKALNLAREISVKS
ncbi:iron-sulfur cluster repair di-iron protein [Saccharicrinis sp. FJH54]|uniref:iron-sulfur cluster repair di-iron protein n=1 Tax=Saccharicrinis sp. FJH54 TaxID=3344665 RepID=UPI0035D4840F